ncbi:MAG TPA: MoaD/ThiS family protein [Puia sp.]|nr:MoaD/ThiS family protein [Puia sp.]
MNVEIILFGQLKDIIGKSIINVNDVDNLADLQKILQQSYPALLNTKFVVAVDRKIVSGNIKLSNKNEIALLPPFSGG